MKCFTYFTTNYSDTSLKTFLFFFCLLISVLEYRTELLSLGNYTNDVDYNLLRYKDLSLKLGHNKHGKTSSTELEVIEIEKTMVLECNLCEVHTYVIIKETGEDYFCKTLNPQNKLTIC